MAKIHLKKLYLLIYLAALCLSCGTQALCCCIWFLFSCAIWALSYVTQDVVPSPGIKPEPSALEVWSPNRWNTWEVPLLLLLQSCLTLCDPIDGSPPGSPVPGMLQARTLEWVAISFSSA